MYNMSQVLEDMDKFCGTNVLITDNETHKSEVFYTISVAPIMDGALQFLVAYPDDMANTTLISSRTHTFNWSPQLVPRYYFHPDVGGYWLSMSARRQYKVGLNSRSCVGRDCRSRYLGAEQDAIGNSLIKRAIDGSGTECMDVAKSLKTLKKYDCAPLAPHIAMHLFTPGLILLVHDAQHIRGLVHEGVVLVDSQFKDSQLLPEGIACEYRTPQELSRIFTSGRTDGSIENTEPPLDARPRRKVIRRNRD